MMEHQGGGQPGKEDREGWYRQRSLPLYGLPASYTGPRMLGDSHRGWVDHHDGRGPRRTGTDSLGLLHGDPLSDDEPWLQVITTSLPGPDVEDLLRAESKRPNVGISMRAVAPARTPIVVDGRQVVFAGVGAERGWAVQADLGHIALSVVGVRWPLAGLELVSIPDPEPYIAGREDYVRRRFRS